MASFTAMIIVGFFMCGFLILGHVLGMMAADYSMDIMDFNPVCVYENEYDYVTGDFSEVLVGCSWAGIVIAVLVYAALIVGNRGKQMYPFYCILCVYSITYIVWLVLLVYIMLFFSYIYFEKPSLVHTCGGFPEVRETWWMCFAALIMIVPASISGSVFCCLKS